MTVVEPELTLEKTGPAQMSLEVPETFTLDVHNTSGARAWGTTMYDVLPNEAAGGMCAAPPAQITAQVFELLSPETVSPGVVFLASRDAPSRTVLGAGGGSFAVLKGLETRRVNRLPDKHSEDGVAAAWDAISNEDNMQELKAGFEQTSKYALMGAANLGIDLSE